VAKFALLLVDCDGHCGNELAASLICTLSVDRSQNFPHPSVLFWDFSLTEIGLFYKSGPKMSCHLSQSLLVMTGLKHISSLANITFPLFYIKSLSRCVFLSLLGTDGGQSSGDNSYHKYSVWLQ